MRIKIKVKGLLMKINKKLKIPNLINFKFPFSFSLKKDNLL